MDTVRVQNEGVWPRRKPARMFRVRLGGHLALVAVLGCLFPKVKVEERHNPALPLKRSLSVSVIQFSHPSNEDSNSYTDKPHKILSRSNRVFDKGCVAL